MANSNSNSVSIWLGLETVLSGRHWIFAGEAPAFIAAGDFNRDGKLDLAVANLNSNNVRSCSERGPGYLSQS